MNNVETTNENVCLLRNDTNHNETRNAIRNAIYSTMLIDNALHLSSIASLHAIDEHINTLIDALQRDDNMYVTIHAIDCTCNDCYDY